MSPACCQSCLVRFTAASAASVEACPRCGQALDYVAAAREVLGYQLLESARHELPAAAEAALPAPEPRPRSR